MEISGEEHLEGRTNSVYDAIEDMQLALDLPQAKEFVEQLKSSTIKEDSFLEHLIGELVTQLRPHDDQYAKLSNVSDVVNWWKNMDFLHGINLFEDRCNMIDFLISELQTRRMIYSKRIAQESPMDVDKVVAPMLLLKLKAPASMTIKDVCGDLLIPMGDTPAESLKHIHAQVLTIMKELSHEIGANYISSPIISFEGIPQKHMQVLVGINDDLKVEYEQRKEVLLKRLDVSLQSFSYSSKGEEHSVEIKGLIKGNRSKLNARTDINAYDTFAAHRDLVAIALQKTSGKKLETQSSLKTLRIGSVPDRGGRIDDRRGGVMPTFHSREETTTTKPQRDASHHGGGRGRGGRVQGGWKSDTQKDDQHTDHQQNRKTGSRGRGGNWGGKRGRW